MNFDTCIIISTYSSIFFVSLKKEILFFEFSSHGIKEIEIFGEDDDKLIYINEKKEVSILSVNRKLKIEELGKISLKNYEDRPYPEYGRQITVNEENSYAFVALSLKSVLRFHTSTIVVLKIICESRFEIVTILDVHEKDFLEFDRFFSCVFDFEEEILIAGLGKKRGVNIISWFVFDKEQEVLEEIVELRKKVKGKVSKIYRNFEEEFFYFVSDRNKFYEFRVED